MILSDRSIREELAAGRIAIEPLDEGCIQPSSVDLHLDRYFRVFLNHTMRVIDVKEDQEELTELVEIGEDDSFVLHPGEFVLGSTSERVTLPNDLVARLEGKSSLGRLGLLIHSSLPASERVMVLVDGVVSLLPIGEIVRKRLDASVVAFDPETFEVSYQPITGWFEGPPDRIFEVVLASGRSVRVTAAHNLFTLDPSGAIKKLRTLELAPGSRVAIPRFVPDPPDSRLRIDLLDLTPEPLYDELLVEGTTVAAAFDADARLVSELLVASGRRHVDLYRRMQRLPLRLAMQVPGLRSALTASDRLVVRGGRQGLPVSLEVDPEFAWFVGIYVAEGSRRRNQVVISNTDPAILDRAQSFFERYGLGVYRTRWGVTCSSTILSHLVDWLGAGPSARFKQVPELVFGWPQPLLESFVEGFVDGDGSRDATRTSFWSSSDQLVDDLLWVCARMGRRASAQLRVDSSRYLYQVSVPHREHKLLTAVPLPDRLLVELREQAGLTQVQASEEMGYRHPTDLCNIELRSGRDAVRLQTLRRFRDLYARCDIDAEAFSRLERLVEGDLLWDTVVEVRDTGLDEEIFDIEVRPDGRHVENFLAGTGGVFVSNTAGFVDAGWDGHLTLELSNVANLPIALYPGMKIGQISFLRMTTPADAPYGSAAVGSKYQGQRGPTPSRYFENFKPRQR